MEYYVMRQDPDVKQAFKMLHGFNPTKSANQLRHLRMSKEEMRVIFVEDHPHNEYPDFIERPFDLIGDKLKRVLSLYQPNIYFETMIMIEHQRVIQTVYHLMVTPEIDCASKHCVHYFGKIDKLVLDIDKIGHQRIFRVTGDYRIIVRLDVVESILRRIPYGIVFEPVKLEQKVGVVEDVSSK